MADWAKLKVVDLKAELKRRGLPQYGLKGELIARLEVADDDDETDQPAEEEQEQQPEPEPELETEAEADEAENDTEQKKDEEPGTPASATISAAGTDNPAQEATILGHNDSREDIIEVPIGTVETSTAVDANRVAVSKPIETIESVIEDAQLPDAPLSNHDDDTSEAPIAPSSAGVNTLMEEQLPESVQTNEVSAVEATLTSDLPFDSVAGTQKRKRRSATPQLSEEEVARKRLRTDDVEVAADESAIAPAAHIAETAAHSAVNSTPEANQTQHTEAPFAASASAPLPAASTSNPTALQGIESTDNQALPQDMDYERDVAPAIHPATSALYIGNLMRPLRPNDIQAYLAELASSSTSDDQHEDIIVRFYLDQIRTHAFVIFKSVSAASKTRTALHDRVWPNESNRKALLVDFVPPEKVSTWIEMEESSSGGRSGSRWEVVYQQGPDGIEAHLESGSVSSAKAGPPPGGKPLPNNRAVLSTGGIGSTNSIPLGPRGHRDQPAPPTGPRADRPGPGPTPRYGSSALDKVSEKTKAKPVIYYQLVSEDLARRRISSMRSFYSRDPPRDLGRDINRYSFEEGDSFVDRGKEVFEGIRPPHRERAKDRDRHGGGRGGFGGRPGRRGPPSFRPRSDRYLPGFSGGGGSRDDRSSRHNDDRNRSYRDRR